MSDHWTFQAGMEPERYELDEAGRGLLLQRREFFQMLGGGIVVLFLLGAAEAQESGGGRRRGPGGGGRLPQEISAWLHIGEDGRITVYTGKVEVGQNTRTTLTQLVAEELRAPLASVRLVMGDTALVPFDAGTFGSQSTPMMGRQLRRVAAAAREMLLDLAAEEWKVERPSLSAKNGKVVDADTNATIDYGKLTKGQKLARAVSDEVPLTPAGQWTVAGHSATKVDARAMVTGRHQYASDIHLPGMQHGKVLRPASYGATLASLDTKAAEAMPGVTVVHEGDFVGVVAPTELAARRALAAIKAEWNTRPQSSSKELFDQLTQQGRAARGRTLTRKPAEQPSDGVRLEQAYQVAYIAHAPLEPRAAVAQWEDGKLTVWTGTQRPFGVRGELATAFKLPEDQVHVLMPDTGSGYGGKHTGEAAVEAARLAKAAGKPVKLRWSREEEFTWAYFRPAGVIEVSSLAGKDGVVREWEFHNYNSGASAVRSPYDIPGQRSEFHPTQAPLRQGSYRGLAATANHFARETHMDELAHALGMEPLQFRLKNLKDERLRAVFQAAAEKFGWGDQPAAGHGYGIAGGTEKGGYVATCAEVAVDRTTGQVRLIRAVSAFECGAIVNPDHLRNQVEGALVMGIGGALFEAIQFENGRITNPRFSKYRVPRFKDAPPITVVLLDRKDLPSAGAGESPIMGIAPAIGNAIFAATGVRLRSMPLDMAALKG